MKISEYVSIGHPDKIADYISEYILDRLIEQDKNTKYALEVQIKDNYVTLAGEVSTNATTDYKKWVIEAISEIGYTHDYAKKWGAENTLDCERVISTGHISQQSNDIAQGVNNDGWGDQGIMFGYAENNSQTNYMPIDYFCAKKLCNALYESGLGGLDIKTQIVTQKNRIKKVIIAIPLLEDKTKEIKRLAEDVLCAHLDVKGYDIIINGTGKYVKHSSMGDCGTTGRKLAVDFYGGNCNVGGGSPWTKDGTKADLTLNLYARQIAVDYIKSHSEYDSIKVGIGCCIGKSTVDVYVSNHDKVLEYYTYDITPSTLIKKYELDKPIYTSLCRDGLFSRIK